jgi:hypothetical protein
LNIFQSVSFFCALGIWRPDSRTGLVGQYDFPGC